MTYETTNKPHVVQRNSKLYVTTVVNTGTTGQIGNVFITQHNTATGAQLATKYVTIDTQYQLQNAQLVPDLSNSGSSGINLYLVVTVKNGQYVYIQQIDDTLTFSSSAITYHQSATAYVDTSGHNGNIMVQGYSDSYYLMINFKQFYQTGTN